MKKISEIIQKEIEKFKEPVDIGYIFDWHTTVKRILRYKVDKYLEDSDALFFNIIKPQSPHFQKNIDIDTKDLDPYGLGDVNFLQAWLLRVVYRLWARESKLGITLNELSGGETDFGFHVFKKVPEGKKRFKLKSCDLTRIFFDVTDKDFSTCIEEHHLTKEQIESHNEDWEDVDGILKGAEREDGEEGKYILYEREGMYDGVRMHQIIAGQGDKEIIAFEEELEKDERIYFAFSLNNAEGRLPGIGIYERNFELQRRANELVNQNAETTAIASLLILQSEDGNITGNALQDMDSGQIISGRMSQVAMNNPAIASFIQELNILKNQVRENCMTPEIMTGDNMPSGTAFRSIATISNAAKSAFKNTRDDIGTNMADILLRFIFPPLIDEYKDKDFIEIAQDDNDIKLYDSTLTRKVKKEYYAEKMKSGERADPIELQQRVQNALRDAQIYGRKIEIKKGFFDFKYGIYVNVTGEAIDKNQQNDAMYNALQLISANPAIIKIPLFRQYVENNGVNWQDLEPEEEEQLMQAMQSKNIPQEQASPMNQTGDKLLSMVNS